MMCVSARNPFGSLPLMKLFTCLTLYSIKCLLIRENTDEHNLRAFKVLLRFTANKCGCRKGPTYRAGSIQKPVEKLYSLLYIFTGYLVFMSHPVSPVLVMIIHSGRPLTFTNQ